MHTHTTLTHTHIFRQLQSLHTSSTVADCSELTSTEASLLQANWESEPLSGMFPGLEAWTAWFKKTWRPSEAEPWQAQSQAACMERMFSKPS